MIKIKVQVKSIFGEMKKKDYLQYILNKKRVHILILILILVLAAYLKLNHFSDWLHYEFDQSRDNILVAEGIKNGPAGLPLLGPKADGTQLRVGPAYYYMEYLSALIFGDTPAGHAYFVPILSLISIVVFYALLRRYFSTYISLGMSYLYAISFYMTIYSRFGWNPNVLPFFIISGIYCLLRATDGKSRYPGRWFLASSFLFGVAIQIHFVAFFSLPFMTIVYLLYKRPRFSWKAWAGGAAIVLVMYIPVILSDALLDGYNTKQFISAFGVKTDQKDSLGAKIISVIRSGSENYLMIISGNDRIWMPKVKIKGANISLSCTEHCKKSNRSLAYAAFAFFATGLFLFAWRLIKDRKRGIIIGIFFISVLLVMIPIAHNIEPRFYLLAIPLPFFFLATIIDMIGEKNDLAAKVIFFILIAIFSYTNLSYTRERFSDLENADKKTISPKTDRILGEPERVNLRQFESISQAMAEKYKENGYPVLYTSENLYSRSFRYLTEKMGAPVDDLKPGSVYQKANNFVILRTRKAGAIKSYLENYDILSKKQFGTMTLFELAPKSEKVTDIEMPKTIDSFHYIITPWQITWGDAFGKIFRSK